jgi:hypothetical protein
MNFYSAETTPGTVPRRDESDCPSLTTKPRQRKIVTANERIRVSDTGKREPDRCRRSGESYNDVLQRLLADDRDLLAGFGR